MVPMALGGIVGMADGGQADIYEPNNPTFLIGDNKRVREAFIPEDGSPRSQAILKQTVSDMGYGLIPKGALNPATVTGTTATSDQRPIVVNLSFPGMIGAPDRESLRRAAVILRDEIRKVEMAAR